METKVNFIFTKQGKMRFISHLDLMRTFMRALRRADIPIKISQGFNPHPKLSIKRAIKLGIESQSEEASIVLKEAMNLDDFKNRLNNCLPQGIQVKDFLN